jgi:hypothetical protein
MTTEKVMLTEMKKADREAMAKAVEALCASKGMTCMRRDPEILGPKVVALDITSRDVMIGVDFDGTKGRYENRDVFCLPWCISHDSEARFSSGFETIMQAPVNRVHERKCTAFAYGFDEFLMKLEAGFDAIASGAAFPADSTRSS